MNRAVRQCFAQKASPVFSRLRVRFNRLGVVFKSMMTVRTVTTPVATKEKHAGRPHQKEPQPLFHQSFHLLKEP